MNPIVILGLGAVALLATLSGKKEAQAAPSGGGGSASKPKPTSTTSSSTSTSTNKPKPSTSTSTATAAKPHGPTEIPPAEILGRITAAVASGDPVKMRAEAAKLRKEGWVFQADQLTAAAATQEQANAIVPILPPTPVLVGPTPSANQPVIPGVSLPESLPGVVTVPTLAEVIEQVQQATGGTDAQSLAIQTQRMLTLAKPYKEDRALVKQWQAAEGVKNPDGLYGPNAAKLAIKYDLVPVKPYYWSSNAATAKTQKADWKKAMLAKAKADPSRAAEWTAASKV